jgi:uncharacterized coiled-coil DUF342 family protein
MMWKVERLEQEIQLLREQVLSLKEEAKQYWHQRNDLNDRCRELTEALAIAKANNEYLAGQLIEAKHRSTPAAWPDYPARGEHSEFRQDDRDRRD